jgi:hypothetical protein
MTSRKPHRPTKRRSPEAELQRFIVQTLKLFGVDGLIYFSVPNESKRSAGMAVQLKAMGMLPGVADLVIIRPNGLAAMLECKSLTGIVSLEQHAFSLLCASNGVPYRVCRTAEEATAYLAEIGALRKNPLARAA